MQLLVNINAFQRQDTCYSKYLNHNNDNINCLKMYKCINYIVITIIIIIISSISISSSSIRSSILSKIKTKTIIL